MNLINQEIIVLIIKTMALITGRIENRNDDVCQPLGSRTGVRNGKTFTFHLLFYTYYYCFFTIDLYFVKVFFPFFF